MIFLSRYFALFCLPVLVSCTSLPQPEPCMTPQACEMSQLMVERIRPDIGLDFGSGLILRNIQAAGALVVFDLQLPLPGAPLEEVQKRALHEVSSQQFVAGFCEDTGAPDIFRFGNAFQVRTVGNDGVLLGASTLRSCGGS